MTKSRKIKIISCVAIILAVAAGAAWFWFNREPDSEYGFRVRFNSVPERTATVDGMKWHYAVIDGEAQIVKAVRRGAKPFFDRVVLPKELDGYPVTGVWGSIFKDNDPVRSLVIPEGVKEIGWCAFNGVGLDSVTIPSTVTNIGQNALRCENVRKYVVSPDNQSYCETNGLVCTKDGKRLVRCIGGDVTIPEGVTNIPSWAFSGSNLKSVVIPQGVVSIGMGAFSECKQLKSISIPSGVTDMGAFTFEGCLSLEHVDFQPGVTNIEDYAYEGCKNLKKVVVPEGVVEISKYAFANCENLESVTLPSSVKRIGWHAFSCCSRKLKMTMNLSDAHISIDAFSGFNDLSNSRGVNRQGFKYEKDGTCTFDGRPIGEYSDTSN